MYKLYLIPHKDTIYSIRNDHFTKNYFSWPKVFMICYNHPHLASKQNVNLLSYHLTSYSKSQHHLALQIEKPSQTVSLRNTIRKTLWTKIMHNHSLMGTHVLSPSLAEERRKLLIYFVVMELGSHYRYKCY